MRPIEQDIFAKKQVQMEKLEAYGFVRKRERYIYQEKICEGSFLCEVSITKEGNVDCSCIDLLSLEPYDAIYISYQNGSFVSHVRESYLDCLQKIADAICIPLPFQYPQANRLAQWMQNVFHESPQPFSEKAKDYIVFQNHENQMMHAMVSTIPHAKMEGNSEEKIEVLNVKADPDDVNRYLSQEHYYPAWHMNKKNWISILLNDSLSDEEIQDLLSVSRGFTLGKKAKQSPQEIHAWLIPSNPAYFDIVGAMENRETITWRQTSNVHAGDDVYLYVGKPYSAIMYRFEAVEVNLDYGEGSRRLMVLRKMESYDPQRLPLTKMRQFGTNTPRGPRTMPKELIEILQK